jgi:peptide chain release factor 1
LKVLRARCWTPWRPNRRQISEQRRGMVGSGDRSERIRTYNFPRAA